MLLATLLTVAPSFVTTTLVEDSFLISVEDSLTTPNSVGNDLVILSDKGVSCQPLVVRKACLSQSLAGFGLCYMMHFRIREWNGFGIALTKKTRVVLWSTLCKP